MIVGYRHPTALSHLDRAPRAGATRLWTALIVLAAFAFRVAWVQALPYDYDRSYSPGIGLSILNQVQTGMTLIGMLHSESSNSGLTNPALPNYVFALVEIFDQSPYVVTLLSAMLGVLVPVFTVNLGTRLLGARVGLIAMMLAAGSAWSAFFARGAWYTAFFELAIILPVWLLVNALQSKKPVRLSLPIIAAAVMANFYLVAFAVATQFGAVVLLVRARLQNLPRTLVLFALAWFISVLCLAAVVAANRSTNIRTAGFELVYGNPTDEQKKDLTKPRLNLFTLERLSDLVGGYFDEVTPGWMFPSFTAGASPEIRAIRPAWTAEWLTANRTRSTVINLAGLLGLLIWVWHARSRLIMRVLVIFALIPVLEQIIVTSLLPTFPANHQNMFLAAPMIYLIPALGVDGFLRGCSWLGSRLGLQAAAAGARVIACAVGALVILAIPFVGWAGEANVLLHPPGTPQITDMPLLWQMRLSEAIRANCSVLDSPENPFELSRLKQQYWYYTLMHSARTVRAASDIHVGASDGWQVGGVGGDCAVRLADESAPPYSERVPITASEIAGRLSLFRAVALPAITGSVTTNNLGWRLLTTDLPARLHPGDLLVVQQRWLVERIASDSTDDARYDTFIKLLGPDGRTAAQADASSVRLATWMPGEQLQTATRLLLPADLKPGAYRIELTHYDRNQKKNAVFTVAGNPASNVSLFYELAVE